MGTINKIQKRILSAGIFLFILINIFPPWVAMVNPPLYSDSIAVGYHFLLSPPASKYGYESFVVINYGRLFVQWLILILIVVVAFILLRKKENPVSG